MQKETIEVRLIPGRTLPRGAFLKHLFGRLRSWTSTQFSSTLNGDGPEPGDLLSRIGVEIPRMYP